MTESPFASDFRALLARHGFAHPKFAHGAKSFDPARPQVLYSGPMFDQDEMVAATAALCEGKWAVAGEHTHRFESLFSKYLNQAESVAVNSGSSADLLMVAAAKARYGWKDGDAVIVSPCGFPTTISAITLNGLVPVFVDIEWETLNADNDAIEWHLDLCRRFPCKTIVDPIPIRAILVSPVLGNPPDMDRLVALAARYDVKLLLDGCDSLGSTWRGKHLAEYAAASTCSFFPSHHISTIQGGMISSNDTELIRLARQMSQWSRACYCVGQANLLACGSCGCRFKEWLPETQPGVILDHKYIYETDRAYNLQQVDLLSAIGCVQMGKLEAIHAARRAAFERINAIVVKTLPLLPILPLSAANPSWFGYPFLCPDYTYKAALVAHLEAAGVQTRNYFAGSIVTQPGYAHLGRAADYPNANEVLKRVFFVGCAPFYTDAHFAHIEATLKSFKAPALDTAP